MKNIFKILVLTFFSIKSIGQNSDGLDLRNGKLFLKAEIEHRLPPIDGFDKYNGAHEALIRRDDALSGNAINFSFNYFMTQNFSINLGQSFRYGLILYNNDYPEFKNTIQGQKTLLIDYHFSADYFYNLRKDTDLFVKLGFSFLNNGSEYSITQKLAGSNETITTINNQNYNATNLAFGYRKRKIDLSLGVYFAKKVNYTENDGINTIYFKIGYNLFKL